MSLSLTLLKGRLHWILIAVLFSLAVYVCFKDLGAGFFENWDEAWYAEVTKQMIRTGNPIVLYWNGRVFLDKTPLNFWIDALSSLILGLSEFSIRLPSAVSGLTVIIIVTVYALKRWGWLAAIAAYAAIVGNNIFIWRVRTGNLDALATLLILITFFVMVSRYRYRLPILGALFGLTFLQKASLVGYPLAIFVLYEIVFNWRQIIRNIPGYLLGAGLCVSIVGAWLYLGNQQVGPEFAQYYLYRSDQGVADIGLRYLNSHYFWHTYYALQRRLFYVFIIGVAFLLIHIRRRENLALLAFALAMLIQLSLTQKDNNWYLVPSSPFWALTVGYGVWSVVQIIQTILSNRSYVRAIQIIMLIPLLYVFLKTLTVNIHAIITTRANVHEVASARIIRNLSHPQDVILRLDYSYPVMIYYADRVTYYHTTIDDGLSESVKNNNITWVVGKKEQVEKFVQFTGSRPTLSIPSGDEMILKLSKDN